MKLIMTKGLPASGKTTWSKEYIKDHPNTKIVCRDDLRAMFDNGAFSRQREKFIVEARDMLILRALLEGYSVISADTNLDPKVEERLREIAKDAKAQFEIQDFTDVPLRECLKRDRLRGDKSVGDAVILRMYKQYLEPKAVEYNAALPDCIICDIDGCLASMNGRHPYEWEKVGTDLVNEHVAQTIDLYRSIGDVFLFSGRDGVCRGLTIDWLERNNIEYDGLYMRGAGDSRKDSIIKKELYETYIKDKYNVLLVIEDRLQVIDLWTELGLPVLSNNPLGVEF